MMRFNDSSKTWNLPAGTYAQPGIYVVSHHEPAHIPPHEIAVAEPTLLPACRLCADVRFSMKSPMPESIAENHLFWPVSHQLSVRAREMAAELRALIENSHLRVLESREFLHRHNGHS